MLWLATEAQLHTPEELYKILANETKVSLRYERGLEILLEYSESKDPFLVRIALVVARAAYLRARIEDALSILDSADRLSAEIGAYDLSYRIQLARVSFFRSSSKLNEAVQILEELRLKLKDPLDLAEWHTEHAYVHFELGNHAAALESAKRACSISVQDSSDVHRAKETVWSAQFIHSKMLLVCGFYEKSFEEFGRCLMMTGLNDAAQRGATLAGLSSIYLVSNDFSKSLELSLEALGLCETEGLRKMTATHHSNIGRSYKGLGNLSAAYRHHMMARKMRLDLGLTREILRSNMHLVDVLFAAEQFDDARYFAEESLRISERMQWSHSQANAHLFLSEIDRATGDKRQAAYHAEKAVVVDPHMNPKVLERHKEVMLEYYRSIDDRSAMARVSAIQIPRLEREPGVVSDPAEFERARLVVEEMKQEIDSANADYDVAGSEFASGKAVPKLILRQKPATSEKAILVKTLGTFSLVVGGLAVTPDSWKRKKNRDVFKVLLLHHGKALHIDQVIEILWGECPPDTATNTVWNAVSTIRMILQPDLAKPADSTYLKSIDRSYRLDLGAGALIDVIQFEKAVSKAMRQTDAKERIESLRDAIDLYGGDLFPGDNDWDWISEKRLMLASTFDRCAHELLRHAKASADFGNAAHAAEAILRGDALDIDAYMALIEHAKHNNAGGGIDHVLMRAEQAFVREIGQVDYRQMEKLRSSARASK